MENIKLYCFIQTYITLNTCLPYLSHSSDASKEDRVIDRQQFFHQVSIPHRVCGGYQHLKEGQLTVIAKGRNDPLPWLQTFSIQVHIHAP